MRVIAGRWRGRKLAPLKGDRVRPTSDRVKEAMFSMLAPDLPDALVLDLCCGTGGLGVEALSRGARRVILVDNAAASIRQTATNLERVGAEPSTYELIRTDAVSWLATWRPPAQGRWLLLSDPPYAADLAGRLLTRLLDHLPHAGFAGAIIEHAREAEPAPDSTVLACEQRNYGNCCVTIARPAARRPRTERRER